MCSNKLCRLWSAHISYVHLARLTITTRFPTRPEQWLCVTWFTGKNEQLYFVSKVQA